MCQARQAKITRQETHACDREDSPGLPDQSCPRDGDAAATILHGPDAPTA